MKKLFTKGSRRFFASSFFSLALILAAALIFYASSQGPFSPSVADKSDYGTIDRWTRHTEIKSSDDDHSYVEMGDSDSSDYIEARKLGFDIPIGATIDGIEVTVERKGENSAIKDASVRLIKGGTVSGNNYALPGAWPASDASATYGGSTDLWGLAWTGADINADNFGVAVAVKRAISTGSDERASIDHVTLKVYYTVVLPVELLSFTAQSAEKEVELKWATASEKDNDYFSIERSENGVSFSEVVKIDGAGNLSTKRDYTARDSDPLEGLSYYRLRQVDFNGASVTYNPVAITRTIKTTPCTFRVYPNPCPGNCNVLLEDCPEGKEKEISLAVFDALGNRVVSNVLLRDEKGGFNFSLDVNNNLMPGVYIVQAANETEKYQEKVIVKTQ